MKKSLEDSKRILVYRLGSLGDTLVALPAFHVIREKFPKAHITILTSRSENSVTTPLETILPKKLFDALIIYPLKLTNPLLLLNLMKSIISNRFDLVINLAESRGLTKQLRDLLFFKLCAIPHCIGFSFSPKDLYLQKQLDDFYEPERERIFRRIRSLTEKTFAEKESLWDMCFTEEEIAKSETILNTYNIQTPYACVSLGSQFEEKKWPPKNWSLALSTIQKKNPQLKIVAIGAKDEKALSDKILSPISNHYINLCGVTNPRISALIIKKSLIFLGHDSGPMHLAATVGTPCVAIFSIRKPKGLWYPRGNYNLIFYPNTKIRERSIDTIDPEIVGEQAALKVQELLNKKT